MYETTLPNQIHLINKFKQVSTICHNVESPIIILEARVKIKIKTGNTAIKEKIKLRFFWSKSEMTLWAQ